MSSRTLSISCLKCLDQEMQTVLEKRSLLSETDRIKLESAVDSAIQACKICKTQTFAFDQPAIDRAVGSLTKNLKAVKLFNNLNRELDNVVLDIRRLRDQTAADPFAKLRQEIPKDRALGLAGIFDDSIQQYGKFMAPAEANRFAKASGFLRALYDESGGSGVDNLANTLAGPVERVSQSAPRTSTKIAVALQTN